MNKKKKSTNTSPYPDEVIDRLARAFYPAILACWNSEEVQRSLVGARPLHLACARPFGRLKAPLGLSLLRFAAQTRTTLFLLCTKSCIVWRKIGVWCSFRWKFVKRKSLKLLGTSRSFRLCHLKIGNLLFNRLHRGDVARNSPVFVQQAPTTSTIPGDFLKNPPTSSNSVHESCVQFWSQPFFDGA